MSGVAAIYERGGAPAEEARITAMLGRLRHRGPDRSAHRVEGSVALAQCMLETTPEDAIERQPCKSPSADVWIIADARIDNRDELLCLRGGDASDTPDSALILWAYERWGEDCPSRLLGDFAFVIWDRERRRIFCARDHLGVRQLYYHHDAVAFRCASEMHALFADRRVPKRPDRRQIALYLTTRYSEKDATLYDGVLALPGGHALTVSAGGEVRVRAYWQPDLERSIRYSSDGEYAAHFGDVFGEAVRCRLRARGPMAAEVSGGLDSSSVACEAERLRRVEGISASPITLMRVAFPGLPCDESPYSQAVADHLGVPMFTARPLDDPELCRPAPTPPDEYFDPTCRMFVPTLREAAARGIRATLTGVGGDLLMRWTGYESLHHLRRGNLRDAVAEVVLDEGSRSPAAVRGLVVRGISAFMPPGAMNALRRVRRTPRKRWPWLTRAMADAAMDDVAHAQRRAAALHPDPIARMLGDDLVNDLATPFVLAVSDRMAASFGAEYRHPFMDVRVIEYLLAIPNEQRYFRALPKPVLRRAMAGTLPPLVQQRRDKGEFTWYLRRGLLEPYAEAIRGLFDPSHLEDHGIIDGGVVRSALRGSRTDIGDSVLTQLTSMELWIRQATRPADSFVEP